MSEGNQNRAAPRKLNALSEYKLRLIGDPVNGAKRRPTLGFSFHKNQPQIDVRTNVDGDKDFGRISAKLDTPTFFAIVPAIESMCRPETPNNTKIVVKNLAVRFGANGQRSEPKLDTQLLIGKDAEGLIYMAVTSWERERPIIKFVFRPSEMHTLFDGTGTELSPQAVSLLYAKGWAKLFAAMAPFVLYHEYVEPPPREDRGGGNNNGGGNRGGGNWGGNNNNNGSGGGNRSSGSADAGDDWPM